MGPSDSEEARTAAKQEIFYRARQPPCLAPALDHSLHGGAQNLSEHQLIRCEAQAVWWNTLRLLTNHNARPASRSSSLTVACFSNHG